MPADPITRFARLLLKAHSPAVGRGVVLGVWAQQRGFGPHDFPPGSATAEFLQAARQIPIPARAPQIDLAGVERAFETLLDAAHRKRLGVVYTPPWVRRELIHSGLAFRTGGGAPVICDPACGSGGFLVQGAQYLMETYRLGAAEAISAYLVGIDRDPLAMQSARCLLELFALEHGERLPLPPLRLVTADSLVTPPSELLAQAGQPGGFDLLATNPPYVRLQNLEPAYRARLKALYPEFARGSYSLALLFLAAGLRLLGEGGCLAVITQNNLFTSLAGQALRRALQERRQVLRVLDFGAQRIFAQAMATTCLLYLGANPQPSFEHAVLSEPAGPEALARVEYARLPFAAQDARKWRLANGQGRATLEKLERAGRPLGEIASIRIGFATLCEQIFVVALSGEDIPIRDGVKDAGVAESVGGGQSAGGAQSAGVAQSIGSSQTGDAQTAVGARATGSDGRVYRLEPGILRSIHKISAVQSASDLERPARAVIFPYRCAGEGWELIPENELQAAFPQAYAYLSSHRRRLAQRDHGRRAYPAWYAWGRTQGMHAPGPKLLTKAFSRQPNFLYDPSDTLYQNGYGISLKPGEPFPGCAEPLRFLQRTLNSPLLDYYLRLTSIQLAGRYPSYQKNFIERFTIPEFAAGEIEYAQMLDDEAFVEWLCGGYGISLEDLVAAQRWS